MSLKLRRVIGDLRHNARQFSLIALVLVLGASSVIAALDAQSILTREIPASYAAAEMPDVIAWYETIDAQWLAQVGAQEGVAGVDARRVYTLRAEARDGTWLPMRLTLVRDFSARQVGIVHSHDSAPPVEDGTLLIEQSGASLIEGKRGGAVRLRARDGALHTLPIGGFVHDTAVAPSTQERVIYAFATPATAALIGLNPELDQLWIRSRSRMPGAASQLAGELSALSKSAGRPALRIETPPNAHPHERLMSAMLRVFGVLGALALVCTAALAASMVAVWMRREARAIGIMKAMGSRQPQIAWPLLALAGALSATALAAALPLGALLGREVVRGCAAMLNIDVAGYEVPTALRMREGALAMLVPLGAMLLPMIRAARVSPVVAIHGAGITTPARSRLFRMTWLGIPSSASLTLALRNTWRRPWRLAVTLLALTSGGALLMTTQSNYASLMRVIDIALAQQGHDIEILLQQRDAPQRLEEIANAVPGVAIAEAWSRASVMLAQDRASVVAADPSKRVNLVGIPAQTRLFALPVLAGRLPGNAAEDEVLMTRSMHDLLPALRVGDALVVRYGEREIAVHIVGLVEEIGPPSLLASTAAFDRITGVSGVANSIRVKAGADRVEDVAAALDRAFFDAKAPASQILTRTMVRDSLDEHFKVVGYVLQAFALAAALVGAILLGAFGALNVIERSREAGILRALGASRRQIATIFVVEAESIVCASALLSLAASIALTLALNDAAARTLLHVAVPLAISANGLAMLAGAALMVTAAVSITVLSMLRRPIRATSFDE